MPDASPAESAPASMLPAPLAGVWQWTQGLVREVGHVPRTLGQLREALAELVRLPDQLDRLTATLERTADGLEVSLGELSDAVGGGMHERIEHLDAVVSDLRNTLTGLIGAIPGVRRTLHAQGRRADS